MPIHKLSEGPITLTVASITSVEGNFGPQLRISGDNGVDVYINELSGTKQLARLNHTAETIIGKTVYMEQVKKNGTTYTNISLASAGASSAAPAAAPASYAPVAKLSLSEIAGIYGECVTYAMATFGAKCEEAGIPVDASALQAAAATLFIKATR